MTSLRRLIIGISALGLIAGFGSGTASADSSHARIVRLSLVQGDVRFARDIKGDPLSEPKGNWEAAALNLPIRQGYVVATDSGRAEVEFENGAMAFLAENTVLEFYDLSSEDGGFTTRLILRQGSAEFHVNPGGGDYFSVTGGDFSVQAETKTTFRMNNFDDGSSVNVLRGRLTAITKGKNTLLVKDQSLSLRAGELDSMTVEHAPARDEFDQWVAGRIDAESAATASAMQYSNSSLYTSGYTSGFGDLYTYGAWFPMAGYGNCWRPYGVGFGWSPFDFGSWYYDPFFGWSFLGSQPWGWAPYHYGGWLFEPGLGWVWSPTSTFGAGGIGRWRPVTGVWMRSSTGTVAIVPSHPLDVKGKTPLNLSSGAFAVTSRGVSGAISGAESVAWKVQNKPARGVMQNQLAEVAAPARVTRTMAASTGAAGTRAAAGDRSSAIVFDRAERRFVNADNAKPTAQGQASVRIYPEQKRSENSTEQAPAASQRVAGREGQSATIPTAPTARSSAPPRPTIAPPSVPRAVMTERTFNETSRSGGGSPHVGGSGAMSGSSSRASSSPSSAGSSPSSGARASGGSSHGAGGHPR